MGNEVAGVSQIKFRADDGALKSFKVRDAKEDSAESMSIMENGKEVFYTKVKLKDANGTESYKYVATDSAKAVKPQNAKADKDLPAFFSFGETKYDRGVDSVFDGVLGIDNSKPCKDGKDDGKISGWDKFKHFCKGCLAPVKAIVKHPIKTLAVAALATAAAIAFPVVGTALLVAGLVGGLATLGVGIYKSNAAKTDGEARAAWENIGTGTITTILSAIGLKKAYTASQAKANAFPDSAKYGKPGAPAPAPAAPTKPATPKEIADLWHATLKENGKIVKLTNKLMDQGLTPKQIAKHPDIVAATEKWQAARDAWAAAKGIEIPAPKTSTVEYTGIAKRLQGVAEKAKTAYTSVKEGCKDFGKAFNPKALEKELIPQGQRFDGLGTQMATRFKGLGFHDVKDTGLSTIKSLNEVARTHIHDGHHWQAKDAINYMQEILKAGKVGEEDLAAAQEMVKSTSALLNSTKIINTTPGLKTASVFNGNIMNAFDGSATEYDKLAEGAYTLAS